MIERIESLFRAQPFQPFTISTNDGRTVPVVARERMALGPRGSRLFVYLPGDSFDVVETANVANVQAGTRWRKCR